MRANDIGIQNTPFRQWKQRGPYFFPSLPCLSPHLPDPASPKPAQQRERERICVAPTGGDGGLEWNREKIRQSKSKRRRNRGGGVEETTWEWLTKYSATGWMRMWEEDRCSEGKREAERRWEYICGGQCCETRQVAVTLKMTVIKLTVRRWIWWFWLANQSFVKRTTAQILWPPDTSWLMPVPDKKKKAH